MSDRRRLILAAKIGVFVLVCWGILRSLGKARLQLQHEEFVWADVGWLWFAVAGFAYALSMIPMAWFWQRLLLSMDQHAGWYETFRAYTIGHLGKYVPGKVMVVLLRAGLIRSRSVDGVIAAVTVFIETLTMMATGAFLAAITLLIWFRDQRWLQLLAVGLMLATVFVTLPPILKIVIRKLKSREAPEKLNAILANLRWRSIGLGWLSSCVTWALVTISLWATLRGLPNVTGLKADLTSFAQLLSSVTLAVVAGFLSLLPGGIGVREWVLDQTMVPLFGPAVAIISAVVLRLIWLLTELLLSFILYAVPPRGAANSSQTND